MRTGITKPKPKPEKTAQVRPRKYGTIAFLHPVFQGCQHPLPPDPGLPPLPTAAELSRRLSRRHSLGLSFLLPDSGGHVSTFLPPLAPSPLRDFFATMEALTPAGPALRSSTSDMNTVSVDRQVSLIYASGPPIIPPPNTLGLLPRFLTLPSARQASHPAGGSGLRLSYAGSPAFRPNRVRHPAH